MPDPIDPLLFAAQLRALALTAPDEDSSSALNILATSFEQKELALRTRSLDTALLILNEEDPVQAIGFILPQNDDVLVTFALTTVDDLSAPQHVGNFSTTLEAVTAVIEGE